MATDNPALLRYFLQDDLYLLNADKGLYSNVPEQQSPLDATNPEPLILEPVIEKTPVPAIPAIPQVVETAKPGFNCLGGNKAGFLILVSYTADEHMAPAHLKALESTLSRKTLSLDNVAILNMARYKHHAHNDLITYYTPQKVLILGTAALPTGLPAPKLNSIEQVNNLQQLYTHSFEEMLADREKAKAFWEQMKNL